MFVTGLDNLFICSLSNYVKMISCYLKLNGFNLIQMDHCRMSGSETSKNGGCVFNDVMLFVKERGVLK